MNMLTWFLYLADVLVNLSDMFFFFGVMSLILFVAHAMVMKVDEYPFEGVITGKIKPLWSSVAVGFVLLTLSAMIPSKETMYLMAGSEAGEAVVTSQEGKEILTDIQQVIKSQLKNLKGE